MVVVVVVISSDFYLTIVCKRRNKRGFNCVWTVFDDDDDVDVYD